MDRQGGVYIERKGTKRAAVSMAIEKYSTFSKIKQQEQNKRQKLKSPKNNFK